MPLENNQPTEVEQTVNKIATTFVDKLFKNDVYYNINRDSFHCEPGLFVYTYCISTNMSNLYSLGEDIYRLRDEFRAVCYIEARVCNALTSILEIQIKVNPDILKETLSELYVLTKLLN